MLFAARAATRSALLQRSLLQRAPSLRGLCSVDDALKAALAQVAERIKAADPKASVAPGDAGASTDHAAALPPGATQTSGDKMLLRFTCKKCDDTVTKTISKKSYEEGVVVVRCTCDAQHLIADHLGWFGRKGDTVESILAERGETVQRLAGEDAVHLE
jgi:protein import protein ZIM17